MASPAILSDLSAAVGSVWRTGSGVPSNTLGVNGDFYLRSTNGDVYKKASGVYTVVANIAGPAGSNGTNGSNGAGVPTGGLAGDILAKHTNTDFDTRWSAVTVDPTSDKLAFLASFGALHSNTDGATITFDFDVADQHYVTLGGNRTLAFSHASVGQRVLILLYQDATGGRTVTWWSNIAWNNGLAPVLDPTASGWDLIVLECTGLDGYSVPIWKEVSRSTSAPRRGITSDTDASTITFDLRVSPKHKVTLGGNRTLALTAGSFYVGQVFALKLTQDGTGSRTVTWFSSIKWAGGSAPTLTTTAGHSDWLGFICTDASGSPKFDGFVIGQDLAA